jgi:hypothetical protein
VVVGELVVELVGPVVVEAVVEEVDRGEEVGVLPHAAPVRARAVTTTPVRARANRFRFVVIGMAAGCMSAFHLAGRKRF